jgi:hypothetical protein
MKSSSRVVETPRKLGLEPIRSSLPGPRHRGWRQGLAYLRRGLTITGRGPGVQLLILGVYAAPSLIAGYLAATAPEPALWQQAAMLGLPWITIVLGTVVVMVAVGHQAQRRSIRLGRATWEALRWVPRYLWTNAHTSLVFWIPMGMLLQLQRWQESALPVRGLPGLAPALMWWLVAAGAALYLHTRTVLAPFLAVHGDLPGTLATIEAWRLSGRHFAVCFGTFVTGALPIALPLGLLALGLALALPDAAQAALLPAAPDLTWVSIQAVRPILIPTLYSLYEDLWPAELARREREGAPRMPAFAQALLALTRPLPRLGRWR